MAVVVRTSVFVPVWLNAGTSTLSWNRCQNTCDWKRQGLEKQLGDINSSVFTTYFSVNDGICVLVLNKRQWTCIYKGELHIVMDKVLTYLRSKYRHRQRTTSDTKIPGLRYYSESKLKRGRWDIGLRGPTPPSLSRRRVTEIRWTVSFFRSDLGLVGWTRR